MVTVDVYVRRKYGFECQIVLNECVGVQVKERGPLILSGKSIFWDESQIVMEMTVGFTYGKGVTPSGCQNVFPLELV